MNATFSWKLSTGSPPRGARGGATIRTAPQRVPSPRSDRDRRLHSQGGDVGAMEYGARSSPLCVDRGRGVGVRVWGAVGDRLVEVRVAPGPLEVGFRIVGLPRDRARTTADRVRAAMVNSGVAPDVPPSQLLLEPCLAHGPTALLDLPIALAALACVGVVDAGLGWVF